jgi:hypothetical protein
MNEQPAESVADAERLVSAGLIHLRAGRYENAAMHFEAATRIVTALIDGPSSSEWAAECEEFGCHDDGAP